MKKGCRVRFVLTITIIFQNTIYNLREVRLKFSLLAPAAAAELLVPK
jgi:hypothetical protein